LTAGRSAVSGLADDGGQDEAVLTEKSARIVSAHRLLRRSRRTEVGEFLAEGAPAVTEAIAYAKDHPGAVLELFITEAAAAKHKMLVRAAFGAGVEVTQITERAAASLTDAVTPQGIVVRGTLPSATVADVLAGTPKLVAVLVRASDPGNLGTVIRLADAAGAAGVILACRRRGSSVPRPMACRTMSSRSPTRPCEYRSTARQSRSIWPVPRRSASMRVPAHSSEWRVAQRTDPRGSTASAWIIPQP
jgi:hypothetical protein